MGITTGRRVAAGYHQHGNLSGEHWSHGLRFSVFVHRHLSESARSKGVERRTGVGRREWRTVRRRGDAQGAVWATRPELKVRSEGRNTRNVSASAVWEQEGVSLRVNHECARAS